MSSDAVIAGLKLKQAELAAEHSQLLRRAAIVCDDIAALARAIAIFDPAQAAKVVQASPVKRGRRRGPSSMSEVYGRGDFQRDALEAIRTAKAPITAHGLFVQLTAGKGLKLDDPSVRRGFEKRVSATLSGLKTRGILVNGALDDRRLTLNSAPGISRRPFLASTLSSRVSSRSCGGCRDPAVAAICACRVPGTR